MAKLIRRGASRVVDRCIQIYGGYGVTKDFPFERWYWRCVFGWRRPLGSQRHIIARDILGQSLRWYLSSSRSMSSSLPVGATNLRAVGTHNLVLIPPLERPSPVVGSIVSSLKKTISLHLFGTHKNGRSRIASQLVNMLDDKGLIS